MLTCRHIKTNGRRCGSLAMTGKPYCFFHMKFDQMHKRDVPEIPPIEDSTSVLLAVGQIFRALNYETMDLKRAGLMFYGLQIASSVVARLEKAEPVETVRSVHNLAGDPLDFTQAAKFGMDMLAPVDSVCESNNRTESTQNDSCEDLSVTVEDEQSIESDGPEEHGSTEERYSVEEMETALTNPKTSVNDFRKYAHAYSRYLDEENAKQPPSQYLSINAQSDLDEEHVSGPGNGGCPMSPAVGDMGDETLDRHNLPACRADLSRRSLGIGGSLWRGAPSLRSKGGKQETQPANLRRSINSGARSLS